MSTVAICHFAWPQKTDPTKSPEKELCPEFPKGNLTLGGVRFPGEPKWKIGSPRVQHCLFFARRMVKRSLSLIVRIVICSAISALLSEFS